MKKIIILIINFSFFNCQQVNDGRIIHPERFIKSEVFLSEIAKDIEYVPLSNDQKISVIHNINFTPNSLFLSTYPASILAYDHKGNYLHSIGKAGRGPGEFSHSFLFSIDQNNEQVYVLDNKNILVYNVEGNFQKAISLEKYGSQFDGIIIKNDLIYLFGFINLGAGKYNWLIIDLNGMYIESKINPIPQFSSNRYFGGNIDETSGNQIFYWNQINDTIYKIDGTTFTAEYIFAQGEFRYPKKKLEVARNTSGVYLPFNGYFYPLKLFFTDKYTIMFYSYNNDYHTAIAKTKENLFSIVNSSSDPKSLIGGPGIRNNLDSGLPLIPVSYFKYENNEYLIGAINPFELKAHVASNDFKKATPKYPEKKKELEQLANRLNENDNPVLMIVKLKD